MYDPALTLNSRRFLTLSPDPIDEPRSPSSPLGSTGTPTPPHDSPETGRFDKTSSLRSPRTPSTSSSSHPGRFQSSCGALERDQYSVDTPISQDSCWATSPTESQHGSTRRSETYLVELINDPGLRVPQLRAQVIAKGEYDAVMLIYDVGNRESFDAILGLHSEIATNRSRQKRRQSGIVQRSRSSLFGVASLAAAAHDDGVKEEEVVIAVVGNKSDVDLEVNGSMENGVAHKKVDSSETGDQNEDDDDNCFPPLSPTSTKCESRAMMHRTRSVLSDTSSYSRTDQPPRTSSWRAAEGKKAARPALRVKTTAEQSSHKCHTHHEVLESWLSSDAAEATADLEPNLHYEAGPSATKEESQHANSKRQVTSKEGEALAQALQAHVPFFEASAKTGMNVEEAFEAIVRKVIEQKRRRNTNKANDDQGIKGKRKSLMHLHQPHQEHTKAAEEKEPEAGVRQGKKDAAQENNPGQEESEIRSVSLPPAVYRGDDKDNNRVAVQQIEAAVPKTSALSKPGQQTQPSQRPKGVFGRFKRVFNRRSIAMIGNVVA